MTGYGAGAADAPTARVRVEIRGVNQRFLDVKIALPREYAAWESELRERVRAAVERGRVDVAVTRAPVAARRRYRIGVREELARAYVDAARRLGRRLGVAGDVSVADVLRLPELFETTEELPALERERAALGRAVATALQAFERERQREGAALQRELLRRTAGLKAIARDIRRRVPTVRTAFDERIRERVARLAGLPELDPQRLTQEIVSLAERADITEELVRLAAALRAAGSVGKRVEFLLQEIQRELNTAGAKAADLVINQRVVDGKAEVEKLREQVQNIE
jgi:uncharacterized protein (TIGR00255 family)